MSAGMKGLAADLMAVQFEEDALPIVQFQGRPVHLDNVLKYGADRIATLEAALTRQCDNMAFVLNRVDLHAWHKRFEYDVARDRAALAAGER